MGLAPVVVVVVCCLLGVMPQLRPVTAATCPSMVWETPANLGNSSLLGPLTSDLVVAQRINVTTTWGIRSLTFQLFNSNASAGLVVGVGISMLAGTWLPQWDFGQRSIVAGTTFYTFNYSAAEALNLVPSVYFITLRKVTADGGQSLIVGVSGPQPGVLMPFVMVDLSTSSDGSNFAQQGTGVLGLGAETCVNPSPSPTAYVSYSPSVSPQPLRFVALTTNVTAAFGVAQPAINMSAPLFATASS